jgi:hypothetical protein
MISRGTRLLQARALVVDDGLAKLKIIGGIYDVLCVR